LVELPVPTKRDGLVITTIKNYKEGFGKLELVSALLNSTKTEVTLENLGAACSKHKARLVCAHPNVEAKAAATKGINNFRFGVKKKQLPGSPNPPAPQVVVPKGPEELCSVVSPFNIMQFSSAIKLFEVLQLP
jgi:hypothetical protein